MAYLIEPLNMPVIKINSGCCEGGPLDGEQLAHDRSRYPIYMLEPARSVSRRTLMGEYVWDEAWGEPAWRWKP
jgi:hypothetical protein